MRIPDQTLTDTTSWEYVEGSGNQVRQEFDDLAELTKDETVLTVFGDTRDGGGGGGSGDSTTPKPIEYPWTEKEGNTPDKFYLYLGESTSNFLGDRSDRQ